MKSKKRPKPPAVLWGYRWWWHEEQVWITCLSRSRRAAEFDVGVRPNLKATVIRLIVEEVKPGGEARP